MSDTLVKKVKKEIHECVRVEINEQHPFILLAVYGTLLQGEGNWRNYLEGRSEFLGEHITEPIYTMYGLRSGFPVVTTEGNTTIKCHIFKVRQPNVLQRIHNLEGFRGCVGDASNWYDCIEIDTPYGPAHMYVQPDYTEAAGNIIKSGDWLRRNF